jgi:hypothetical protein
MSVQSRRFIPRLVALDDRSLPSVTYTVTGSTLQITGDDAADKIVITDDGTAAGITVVVNDGQPWTVPGDVSAVVVSAGGGNDVVEYDLTGPLTTTRLVSVDLGKGADTFTANLNGQMINGTSANGTPINLGIGATGGGGGDTMVLNANGATVAPEARLSVDFSGDAGHDNITFNYDPGFLDLGNVTLTKDQKH